MLPVCSTTSSCGSHFQISFLGSHPFSPFQKDFEVKCTVEERVFLGWPHGTQSRGESLKTNATKTFGSGFVKGTEGSVSLDFSDSQSCQTGSDFPECKFLDAWSSSIETASETQLSGGAEVTYVEGSATTAVEGGLIHFTDKSPQTADIVVGSVEPQTTSTSDMLTEYSTSVSDSLGMDNVPLSNTKTSIEDFLAGARETFNTSINKGENAAKSTVDTVNSSIVSVIKSATAAVDDIVSGLYSTADQKRELAGNGLTSFSSDLEEATSKASVVAVDVLRRTTVAVEDSLRNGASFIFYSYGSAKELLPPDIRDALNLTEEKTIEILSPVRMAFQQGYSAIEGLERSVGLDPNDPIVPLVLFLGTSTTLWVFYWVWTYSGYSGDLSPESALEILTGKENALLIDVRPELLRDRDGIPDLRRGARFRYASVTLPEVDDSVRRLLKSGRDLDDTLIAAVIRNLKTLQDRSKVIVMDADGTRSKGIARSLRKLGVKKPYVVKGGFKLWLKNGLRAKELKPETALTVINEDVEAILEEISPSPLQALGFGVVSIAALYALLEWEKTLQLVGVVGLGLTIFRRVASYEDSKDFKQDVRLLLTPVRFGAQALTWAAGKLETNGLGLPTSPSSLNVQNRVLQAAAKHESQPADTKGVQDPSPEGVQDAASGSTIPVNE